MLFRLHSPFFWRVYSLFSPLPSQHGERKPITFFSWFTAEWRRLVAARHCPAHCALEAVVVVAAAPLAEAAVKREFWMDSAEVEAAWRLATGAEFPVDAAAETKLTGLLVSRERFWGFRNRGAVTMLGAPPALANTRFPVASSDVIGREPPEARATNKNPKKQAGGRILTSSQRIQTPQSSTEFSYASMGEKLPQLL